MNRLTALFVLLIAPALALADGSMSFAPPPSDYSIVFLGNIFGIVGGVLNGTGSQIMGTMFAVFNSAVLALGGMIIMYTLMVSTMNTAHEGQMLGQKWSSIWIPMRSTIGMALLIPKASGYCMMQVFVMWLVVQGVGAADKIWDAALSYLNRGGVIIQAQQINPATALTQNNGMSSIADGAQTILAGQVCMLGLQTQLETQRQDYLQQEQKGFGPCYNVDQNAHPDMYAFCKNPVPDFMGSVNAVSAQSLNSGATDFQVNMPNFENVYPYTKLNGICGTLRWKNISSILNVETQSSANGGSSWIGTQGTQSITNTSNEVGGISSQLGSASGAQTMNGVTLSAGDLETIQMSRAIAIQQMYTDLSSVAQMIIDNAPGFSTSNNQNNTPTNNPVATVPFGVPLTQSSQLCSNYQDNCVLWGPNPSGSGSAGALFSGTEFLSAINDYNGIMMPTLNLLVQMQNSKDAANTRQFIEKATTSGWIMAGSYFFDLVRIQGSSTLHSTMTDSDSGLSKSEFDASNLTTSYAKNGTCNDLVWPVCTLFNNQRGPITKIQELINGDGEVAKPNVSSTNKTAVQGWAASTVYGFVNNSLMIRLPGQPGIGNMNFANTFNLKFDPEPMVLGQQQFPCGEVRIIFFSFCLGELLGNIFYNYILLFVLNVIVKTLGVIITNLVTAMIAVPLAGIASIYKQGFTILEQPGVNPIVALANMGSQYIDFVFNLMIMWAGLGAGYALFTPFLVLPTVFLAPIVLALVGILTAMGFLTAYYIPMLPYMIFTFGSIAWLIAVIEAMVAAPIVALGVTHPEGHESFGKGEPAIMILLNVFLRPSMMIIGYVAGIALTYVGVWILNSGYNHAVGIIQPDLSATNNDPSASLGYTGIAGMYAYFFAIIIYTSMYLTIVQQSFNLIAILPDKVLRWIGGSPEGAGQEAQQWTGETRKQVESAGSDIGRGQTEGAKSVGDTKRSLDAEKERKQAQEEERANRNKGSTSVAPGGDSGGTGGGGAV